VLLAAADDLAIRSLHLIAAAVWAGGLVFLGLAVGAARRTLGDRERIALFRQLGRRFLWVGGAALLLLIATGTDMAADRLASFGDLFDTDYGERLTSKLGLVLLVIALTAFHSLVQGPALSRQREQALERPADPELAATIRRKAARAGIVSALNLLATLAILVLAARLVTG
jgi:putative copper resistance protein D